MDVGKIVQLTHSIDGNNLEPDKIFIFTEKIRQEANRRPAEKSDLNTMLADASLLERCAEAVHKAYCDYHLKNKGVEYWTKGDYSLLDEPTKQIDRETVKAVLDILRHG